MTIGTKSTRGAQTKQGSMPRASGPGRRAGEVHEVVLRPGAAELNPSRYSRRWTFKRIFLGAGVIILLLALWELASRLGWIDARIYPAPDQIVSSAVDLWNRGPLWQGLLITAWRVVEGYFIGAVAGMVVGLLMGTFLTLRAALEPMLDILYTIPMLSLVPIFLMVFGFGEPPIVAMVAVSVFFFVWISTLAAVAAVPAGYRDSATVMKATRIQMFRHVLLPGSMPEIAVGLRVAAGVAVLVVIGVELLIATQGLGFLISQGRSLFLLAQTYAGIVLSGVLGYGFTSLIRWLTRLAIPWAKGPVGREH